MARPTSFNKRELEKKKDLKRKEKQQRKDERKAGGVTSFEDMIAYVDENGVLHSTPQEKPLEEIDASLIAVSVSKREDVEILPLKGRVEYFNASKGYGFVKDSDSGEKYFFHISTAPASITEGNQVTFELERGQKGLNAVKIEIIK